MQARMIFDSKIMSPEKVIVWVSNEEKENNPDKEYFLEKIKEKAMQLEEAGTYNVLQFKKIDWISSICTVVWVHPNYV